MDRTHSGVCHSDLGVMTNSWKLPFLVPDSERHLQWSMSSGLLILFFPSAAQVGGHEGVGEIAQVGPGSESYGFQVGDRVGVKWIREVCGTCGMYHNRACGRKSFGTDMYPNSHVP